MEWIVAWRLSSHLLNKKAAAVRRNAKEGEVDDRGREYS